MSKKKNWKSFSSPNLEPAAVALRTHPTPTMRLVEVPSTNENALEDAFFEKGHSEDAMIALLGHEQDRGAVEHVRRQGQRSFTIALAATGVIACTVLFSVSLFGARTGSARVTTTPQAVAVAAPVAAKAKAISVTAPVANASVAEAPLVAALPVVAATSVFATKRMKAPRKAPLTAPKALAHCVRASDRNQLQIATVMAAKAIAAQPTLAEAYVCLGGAEQRLGHRAKARDAYLRYLAIAPRGGYATELRKLLKRL